MANKTLLDAVNQILLRVNVIAGNAGVLTSLTDSARQHDIDVSVQVINEGIDELYSASGKTLPGEGAESTLTLATGTREYTLASDVVVLHFPMIDRTNTQYLFQWESSYDDFLLLDPQQLYTGLPRWGMISPITNKLRVDRAPDAGSNGKIYTYEYDKNLAMATATDLVPFDDITFRAMVPTWVQLYKREMRNEFDAALYQTNIGRASRTVTEVKARTHYDPRG